MRVIAERFGVFLSTLATICTALVQQHDQPISDRHVWSRRPYAWKGRSSSSRSRLSNSAISTAGPLLIACAREVRPKARIGSLKGDFEPYWQDEKDWLCIVEFLPTDNPEARLFAADIIGYWSAMQISRTHARWHLLFKSQVGPRHRCSRNSQCTNVPITYTSLARTENRLQMLETLAIFGKIQPQLQPHLLCPSFY